MGTGNESEVELVNCPKCKGIRNTNEIPCTVCYGSGKVISKVRDSINATVSVNPKDLLGDNKLPLHLFPPSAIAYGCLGMLEGKLKYGYVNYRGTKVIASIYIAAAKRHLDAWLEGEENSPDTLSPHLGNALATIAIVVDAMTNGTLIDDRPYTPVPGAYRSMTEKLTTQVVHLKEIFKDKTPKHWYNKEGKKMTLDDYEIG